MRPGNPGLRDAEERRSDKIRRSAEKHEQADENAATENRLPPRERLGFLGFAEVDDATRPVREFLSSAHRKQVPCSASPRTHRFTTGDSLTGFADAISSNYIL